MIRSLAIAVAVLVVAIVLVFFVGVPLYVGMYTPRAVDAKERAEIVDVVNSMLKKPVFALGKAGRSGTNVNVYGLLDTDAREALVNSLRKLQKERGWRPMNVTFYGSGTWVEGRFVREGHLGDVEIP
jgi:hypothetical protein